MIYKTLKKVSEYCQLIKPNFLDKTNAGVTATSNGDTFTVNGTATSKGYISNLVNPWKPIIGHKMFISGCPEGGSSNTFYFGALNQGNKANDFGEGSIFTVINERISNSVGIVFSSGITFDNLVFKPQLFDLTEMYGAGNEPTTVEEFRTKFPNELYDYKPYCFVKSYKTLLKVSDNKIITSYKKSLICTTKNLFDSEDWYNTLHAINSTSMIKEIVNGIEYYKFRPQGIFDYEYMKGEFKENTIYTLSCLGMNADGTNNRYSGFQVYYTDGTRSLFYINTGEEQKYTVTTLSNKTIDYIVLGYNVGDYVLVRNIQLEEGSTATEYQPYGYI